MDGVQVQKFVLVIVDGQAPDVQQVFINAFTNVCYCMGISIAYCIFSLLLFYL